MEIPDHCYHGATQHMQSHGSRTRVTSLPALCQLSYTPLREREDSNLQPLAVSISTPESYR